MNRKKHIFAKVLCAAAVLLSAVSCSYKEEPDRTTDASTTYVTPQGELPTQEERSHVQALIDEYNTYIKTHK